MNILKKNMAPITEDAWKEIQNELKTVLSIFYLTRNQKNIRLVKSRKSF